MGMPNQLLLIRHGESEANVLQAADNHNVAHDLSPEIVQAIRERPDWEQRLTPRGEQQAAAAGRWLVEHGMALSSFDAVYCSFFIRARETAYNIDPTFELLRPHSTIHEQDWGAYGEVPYDQRKEMFPRTYRQRKSNPMFATFDGGESLIDTTGRLRDWRDTIGRKYSGKKVAAIMHGGTIVSTMAMIERWLPEDLAAFKSDDNYRIPNLTLLAYAQENPADPNDTASHYKWRRIIHPDDAANSPFGGEWVELPDRRFLGGAALRASIDAIPRLLPE